MVERSVTELDKSTVLAGLFACWDSIDELLGGLPEKGWQELTPLPGWRVHDVVAHLIGVESMLLGVSLPDDITDFLALDHVRNDIGAMNERWVRHLSAYSAADLHARFQAVTSERRPTLTDLSAQDWNAVTMTPAGPDSYGRFMRIRVFDCWMHEQDIRDAVHRPASDASLQGLAAQLALDELQASMGFVVGKLGKAPDGSRVVFDLTGPLARTIRVVVDGRAQLVDDFDGHAPTVTIRLDGRLFTRLAGGRVRDVPADSGDIELTGDKEVAARIVEHLNFVI
ncbi:MAG: maleylpyruvate isomerase family mycothiol-dependent enzyme [Mycobacteriaceae bacterium]|nr:maleylpyruvate isomerase family mycothiol-dependent enzyme [Mycobacteriaceae bacterium]